VRHAPHGSANIGALKRVRVSRARRKRSFFIMLLGAKGVDKVKG